ncbi:MAG: GNAT family N-acetyltransferase [Saprospiraceae bacterium]|nr:GNAT family N-acetyltransferase [Saprospiraceae bacterium]
MDIRPIHSRKDIARFIDFPYDHYRLDPAFVPEIFIAQRDHLDPKKNPFFENARSQLFLAEESGKVIGRIGVVRDEMLIDYTKEPVGVFGFFEVIEDYRVAVALLDAAIAWVRSEGLTILEGPYNFSTNHPAGLLIDGFDLSPAVMMAYNKPYYQEYLERYGLVKKTDVLAYHLEAKNFPERLQSRIAMLESRLAAKGITVRPIDMKNFQRDVKSALSVYNGAWSDNLGFAPFTEKEFLHVAKDLKLVMDPNLVMLAEKDGVTIGFALAVPDINEVQKTVKRGRLFPFGIFKLLLNKSKIKNVRVIALGVIEQYRKLGIDAYMYARAFTYLRQHKTLQGGEASWILEHNAEMNQAIIKMGGQVTKKYRFYRMIFHA